MFPHISHIYVYKNDWGSEDGYFIFNRQSFNFMLDNRIANAYSYLG